MDTRTRAAPAITTEPNGGARNGHGLRADPPERPRPLTRAEFVLRWLVRLSRLASKGIDAETKFNPMQASQHRDKVPEVVMELLGEMYDDLAGRGA